MSVQKFFNHGRVAAVDMTAVVLSLALNFLVPVAHCKKSFYNDMELMMPDFRDIDFIVIGNGFAGHVVANRLSENPDWKVLLLELSHDNEVEKLSQISYIQLKGNTGLAFKNSTYYWPFAYATQPQRYIRGSPSDYDTWEKQGNLDWLWSDVVPYFEKSVRQNKTKWYSSGYVMLKEPKMSPAENDIKEMVLEAAKYLIPEREATSKKVTYKRELAHIKIPYVVMRKDKKRPNLHTIKGANVAGINFDSRGKRVSNVTVIFQDGVALFHIPVHKELVLSAGTIDSAKLLMLSGVGREEHLKDLNIPVRHKLPVGDNLQDHLIVPLFLEMPSSKDSRHRKDSLLDSKDGTSTGYNASESIGELNINIFFDVTLNHRPFIPDFEYRYFYIKSQEFKKLRNWAEFFRLDEKYLRNLEKIIKEKDLLIVGTVVTHPESFGTVRLRSADYRDMPMITPNYLEEFKDTRIMIDAINYVMDMEKSHDFKKKNVKLAQIPIKECDHYIFKTNDYWFCYMKYFSISQLDHVGTLKMGSPFTSSCVNSRLRVHGISNLRVADASVIPKIPISEVTATSIMIAEKVAHNIKEDYGLLGTEFVRL